MSFELASAALDYDDDGVSEVDTSAQHVDLLASALLDAQVGLDQRPDGTMDDEEPDKEDEGEEDGNESDAEDLPTFHKG